LADKAEENLNKTGVTNYEVQVGDGTRGWNTNNRNQNKFDAIIVSAAANQIPKALKDQLSEEGKLVIPVGSRFSQNLIRLTRKNNEFEKENFGGCVFVPLIGKFSWHD